MFFLILNSNYRQTVRPLIRVTRLYRIRWNPCTLRLSNMSRLAASHAYSFLQEIFASWIYFLLKCIILPNVLFFVHYGFLLFLRAQALFSLWGKIFIPLINLKNQIITKECITLLLWLDKVCCLCFHLKHQTSTFVSSNFKWIHGLFDFT